jgi:hypothetical protein
MTSLRRLRRVATLLFGAIVGLSVAAPATAQGPFNDWREPVVVELSLTGGVNGERARDLRRGRIELGPRDSFAVQIDPYDQRGRRFPPDRFQIGVELQRECDGRISFSETYSGDLEFTTGRSRGRCQVALYVPGNLNLEYLREISRGRYHEAIMNLIQSGEFEASLPSR